jgi:hypothetical protein
MRKITQQKDTVTLGLIQTGLGNVELQHLLHDFTEFKRNFGFSFEKKPFVWMSSEHEIRMSFRFHTATNRPACSDDAELRRYFPRYDSI